MIKKPFILLLAFLGWINQDVRSQLPGQVKDFLPKISAATPDQASLGKYGNYEVSLFSGLRKFLFPSIK